MFGRIVRAHVMLGAACALLLVSCSDDTPPGPPGDASIVDPPHNCARPAPGCACTDGTEPVHCYQEADAEGVCSVGTISCLDGAWGECISVRTVRQGGVGGATSALISPPTACSSCSPGCAEVTDTPVCADLSAGNTSDDAVCDAGGAGVTLPGRALPTVPTCAEAAAGVPPGGSYADYCAGSGSLILEADDGAGGTTETCAGDLAASIFQQALCSCEDMDGTYALKTDSTNSAGVAVGHMGHVYTNGNWLMGGVADIDGALTAYGTGTHLPTRSLAVALDMSMNGDWDTSSETNVGTFAGDIWINGDVTHKILTANGGAGFLRMPGGATVNTYAGFVAGYMGPTSEVITINKPCACDASEIVDIPAFISVFSGLNDNGEIGLDPAAFDGGAGGTVSLPCGRFYLDNVDTSSGFTIEATGRTALFIDGDLSSSASLGIDLANSDAEVDVFISGTLDASAAVAFGDVTNPSRVRVYIGGSADIDMSASGDFNGNFYAPNANFVFGGSQKVSGSLFARHITAGSALDITFDEAILDAGDDCPPPEVGRYWRDYDHSAYCATDGETVPDWGDFSWDADVPTGTTLTFEIQTASTQAGLSSATAVSITEPSNGSPINIGDILVAAGLTNNLPHLRVTAVLQGDGTDAPLLTGMNLTFDCGFGSTGISNPGAFSCGGSPIVCDQVCPPEVCDDGVDNDCDGDIDCADADCGTDSACCLGEICGDFLDNDCDGLEDYYDTECACQAEQCADGLDNDADGDTDCADSDCAIGDACNSYGATCSAALTCGCPSGDTTETSCGDGIDNDCDGNIDCADTADCTVADGCFLPETCANGTDDDGDGLTDCFDIIDCPPGATCAANGQVCDATAACVCLGGATEAICDDGLDNDCDGNVDCVDADCDTASCGPLGATCMALLCDCPLGMTESSCTDGADNDCDGAIDCADLDCDGSSCGASGVVCDVLSGLCECPYGEATEVSCSDGVDNDCDGVADCPDTDCIGVVCGSMGEECSGAGICECPGSSPEVLCTDNLDNDCDGLQDCFDPDCACTPEICDNGGDDDGDGLVDCLDPECDGSSCGADGLTCAAGVCACPGGEANEVTCDDGSDNDCDGDIDCLDADCDTLTCGADGLTCTALACSCPGGTNETTCNDGLDNDCDTQVDCLDMIDCNGRVCGSAGEICAGGLCVCPGGEVAEVTCGDGSDNDCDGLTDCDDPDCDALSCGASGLTCIASACACPGSAPEVACTDLSDNDCDGDIDCADSDCSASAACACPAACDCSPQSCGSTNGSDCDCDAGCLCADLVCAGSGDNCFADCAAGSTCTITGTTIGELDVDCGADATCVITIDTGTNMDKVDCEERSNCDLSCNSGTICELDCNGSGADQASCIVRCGAGVTCSIDTCTGAGPMTCATGEVVCNHACPP